MITARGSAQFESVAGPIGAVALAGDITTVDHRQALASLIRERYGRLDVLVNNPGRCDNVPLEGQTYDQLAEVVDVNPVAVLDLCGVMAPLLFNRGHASVINISSVYGLVASRSPMAAYNATKGAVVNFTRHLLAQRCASGVRVNALAPGYFPSELTDESRDPGIRTEIELCTALGRVPVIGELDGPCCSSRPLHRRTSRARPSPSTAAGPPPDTATTLDPRHPMRS